MKIHAYILVGVTFFSCAKGGGEQLNDDVDARPGSDIDAGTVDSGSPGELCGDVPCDQAVFVDRNTGDDNNTGTRSDPLATINAGITRAAESTPKKAVLISSGIYEEEVTLANGVSLYGGYAAFQGWIRNPTQYITEIHGALRALNATDITAQTHVDGLTITAESALDYGQSSIAVMVVSSTGLVFANVSVTAGDGGPGEDGLSGMAGTPGTAGGRGNAGCEDSGIGCASCNQPVGGTAGGSVCGMPGGRGGRPGNGDNAGIKGEDGAGGTLGGAGGAGGGGGNGQPGAAGATGGAGQDGMGGARIGTFSSAGYTPSDGLDGGDGSPGKGGGGGGGGGGGTTNCDSYGSSGGGGGGGGCGGTKATGGTGGGGSFGIVLLDSTVGFQGCTITAGKGGKGGKGGDGGGGGNGGDPGLGGPYGGSNEQDDGGNGAVGGRGGNGGRGGHGGGGGGGPSVALVCAGESTPNLSGTQLSALGGGTGGLSSGSSGVDGLTSMSYNCNIF